MNEYLNNKITRIKYNILNRNLLKQIAIAEKNLTLSRDELVELQWKKLKDLFTHAFFNCSLYAEKYKKAGINPEDIRNFDDFQRVPVITKKEIRENLDRMVTNGIDRSLLEKVHTGGTTGIPLKIYRDRRKSDFMQALYLRTIRFWGCDIGSKTVWVWGLPKELEQSYDFRYQAVFHKFFKNVTWFNAFDMTNENMEKFLKFLNKFRPRLIIGYVSALCEYAKFLKENNFKIWSPKAIWITAEPSELFQRKVIEDAFGAKTYNQYGLSEILHIATECSERNGLHIHADSRYLEIIDTNNKPLPCGEIGNIVVTDLENRVMPLIRYKNDDLGSLKKRLCKCGCNYPLINDIRGRIYDMITLKNGKKIYGHIFSRILFNYKEQIEQFQVHQISLNNIIVRIVPGRLKDFSKLRNEILMSFQRYTKNLIDYSFESVDQIHKEKSGKLRYVKSDV